MIGVDCSSSLPYRQLRKHGMAENSPPSRSLPYRQLRNDVVAMLSVIKCSLPYRQLRKEEQGKIIDYVVFTAVQAA